MCIGLACQRLAGAVNGDKDGADYSNDAYGADNTHLVDIGFFCHFPACLWWGVIQLLYSPGCESYFPSLEQAT